MYTCLFPSVASALLGGCLGDNLANGAFFLYLAKCSRVIFIPPSWWIFSLPLRPSRLQLKTITGNHAATSPTSPLLLQVHCILQGHPLHTRGLTNVVGRWIHRKNHSGWLSSPSFLGYKQKKYSTVKEGGGKKQTGIWLPADLLLLLLVVYFIIYWAI